MDTLPDDAWQVIVSHMDAETLARFRGVCRLASRLGKERQRAERQATADRLGHVNQVLEAYVDGALVSRCWDHMCWNMQLEFVDRTVAICARRTQYTYTYNTHFQLGLYTKSRKDSRGSRVTLRLERDSENDVYIEIACPKAAHIAGHSESTSMRVLSRVSPALLEFYKLVFEAMPVWSRGPTQRVHVSIGSSSRRLYYQYDTVWDMMDWMDAAKLERRD